MPFSAVLTTHSDARRSSRQAPFVQRLGAHHKQLPLDFRRGPITAGPPSQPPLLLRSLDRLGWRENRPVTSSQDDSSEHRQNGARQTPRPRPVSTLPPQFDEWQIELHGRRVVYRVAGSGPPVVLIHGMLNSSSHWRAVALNLAREHTVIAPDLIGHGDSAAPRGDYSLGAHASSIRDLLAAIGVDRASIVGHSLGGGVAMQFFYQFPQRVERLVLVSSGGLGHEVSPMLRSAALPGVSGLLSMTIHPRLTGALMNGGRRLREREVRLGVYMQALARALRPLENGDARQAFLQTLRAVIDVHGQRVSATDRLYLLERMPTMIVWGERDNTIPLRARPRSARGDPAQLLRDAAQRRALPPPGRPGRAVRRAARVHRRDPARRDRRRRLGRGAGAAFAAAARRGRRGLRDALEPHSAPSKSTLRGPGPPPLARLRQRAPVPSGVAVGEVQPEPDDRQRESNTIASKMRTRFTGDGRRSGGRRAPASARASGRVAGARGSSSPAALVPDR